MENSFHIRRRKQRIIREIGVNYRRFYFYSNIFWIVFHTFVSLKENRSDNGKIKFKSSFFLPLQMKCQITKTSAYEYRKRRGGGIPPTKYVLLKKLLYTFDRIIKNKNHQLKLNLNEKWAFRNEGRKTDEIF